MTGTAVAGVGTSAFGRFPTRLVEHLAAEAIEEALTDALIDRRDIDAAFVGSVFCAPGTASRALDAVGMHGIPALRLEAA